MTPVRSNRHDSTPPKLQEALVLFKFVLNLFGYREFEDFTRDLKDPALEGTDDNGVSHLCSVLKQQLYGGCGISTQKLAEYDQNIIRHTREINRYRTDKIQWKYYQYLAVLFTEVYLDRYFADKGQLLQDINAFLDNDFNLRPENWHGMSAMTENDLNKLAFWCATGAGKTLILHINIRQYLYYSKKYGAGKLNRILILTPNEGLSKQHYDEFRMSGFYAEIFTKQSDEVLFDGENVIHIIDINKLAEKEGDKTTAVENFEGNNLVMVDEGHRGSGGEVWKTYRNKLTRGGFSFEYSATFGQAIAAQSGNRRKELLMEYGKATLFDYSYSHFYNDGYGKDYRIMNMQSWDDEGVLNLYLTAYLLCLNEQMKVYRSNPSVKKRFLIAKPLGIFVGSSVNAVRTDNKRQVSDVIQILLFLKDFVGKPQEFCSYIKRLLDPDDGIRNRRGALLFANDFQMTKQGLLSGKEEDFARNVYNGVLETVFHCSSAGGILHLDKQRGGDEEIGLRIGNADHFGVINVGDSGRLLALCEENGLACETREVGSLSLFNGINNEDSRINILIGSKKFNEGWSSWRVSVMGLMNIGRSEGAEIIQLFGRGVRLKGMQYSLKRSSRLDYRIKPNDLPKGLEDIETLNIFGVRANYMDIFRKYLEDEGLPVNDDIYEKIYIPTVKLTDIPKLKVIKLKQGCDFRKQVVFQPLEVVNCIHIRLDRNPKVESICSDGAGAERAVLTNTEKLEERHLRFIDWNRIFYALQNMKNEHGWYNMELSVDLLKTLMYNSTWYELVIPKADMEFCDFGRDVARWEEITMELLKGYIDRAYKYGRGKWESRYMETVHINMNAQNFNEEYIVEVRKDQKEWIGKFKELRERILSNSFKSDFRIYGNWIQALCTDCHLYSPLLSLQDTDSNGEKILRDKNTGEQLIRVSPAALNKGETTFVKELREYVLAHKADILAGKEVYLLRNESRKGISFFEANNFYPDFILWVNDPGKQRIIFIDPKGIRNLKGLKDPKIQLYNLLKREILPGLNDSNIVLDSYIISNTDYESVSFWGKKSEFINNHVLFQNDSNYIESLFKKISTL